jgi:CubicO group peptidase (beta-lactamase class C family)
MNSECRKSAPRLRRFYNHLLSEAFIPQAATAHRDSGDPVPGKWHTYPEQAAAGLWSTPSDLARLMVKVLKSYAGDSSIVLSAEMTRQMLTPQLSWVGLRFAIIEMDGWTRFEHPGWNEGFHSFLAGCLGTSINSKSASDPVTGRRQTQSTHT